MMSVLVKFLSWVLSSDQMSNQYKLQTQVFILKMKRKSSALHLDNSVKSSDSELHFFWGGGEVAVALAGNKKLVAS